METREGDEQLRIGFIGAPQNERGVDPNSVPIQDLVNVLTAVQRAVFASAAYELGLQTSRNLSDEQRARYTLVVVGSETGSFWEVVRFVAESAASGVVGNFAWQTLLRMLQVFRQLAAGEASDTRHAAVVLPHLITIIETSIRTGRKVNLTYRDSRGIEVSYETSDEGNERILSQARERRLVTSDNVQVFEGAIVRDIVTTDHRLVVDIPNVADEVECRYPTAIEQALVSQVRAFDRVTIYGYVRTVSGSSDSGRSYIEIVAVDDGRGRMILDSTEPF